ncbi:MAG TPA: type 1 glutamine amidotransferase [Acidimicrobiales bacterium]|nr:type 1 glutamine amidotransferase [Acidimicrobiales bacterium]
MPGVGDGPRFLVIQHARHEGPGLLALALESAGIAWTVCQPRGGDTLPSATELDGVVGVAALGGPMGVYDTARYPWLADERELLRVAVDRDLLVVGVCLGAQQLALALGAEVSMGCEPEVGVGEVRLTEDGLADPVLGPAGDPLPCVHWHADTFDLPGGAVRLAGNERFVNQAFRVGERAYALQFHVEVDEALAGAWAPHLPPGVELAASDRSPAERAGRGVVERLVGLAAG